MAETAAHRALRAIRRCEGRPFRVRYGTARWPSRPLYRSSGKTALISGKLTVKVNEKGGPAYLLLSAIAHVLPEA